MPPSSLTSIRKFWTCYYLQMGPPTPGPRDRATVSLQWRADIPSSDSGGEEVLLDVGGQDATEAFEDVGHSDEARETLEQLKVGTLKRKVCTIFPTAPLTWGHSFEHSPAAAAQSDIDAHLGLLDYMLIIYSHNRLATRPPRLPSPVPLLPRARRAPVSESVSTPLFSSAVLLRTVPTNTSRLSNRQSRFEGRTGLVVARS